MALADRIQEARRARNWSREHLAVYSGISSSTVGRIERGEMTPRVSTVIALALALGIPTEELAAVAGVELGIPPDKWSR